MSWTYNNDDDDDDDENDNDDESEELKAQTIGQIWLIRLVHS